MFDLSTPSKSYSVEIYTSTMSRIIRKWQIKSLLRPPIQWDLYYLFSFKSRRKNLDSIYVQRFKLSKLLQAVTHFRTFFLLGQSSFSPALYAFSVICSKMHPVALCHCGHTCLLSFFRNTHLKAPPLLNSGSMLCCTAWGSPRHLPSTPKRVRCVCVSVCDYVIYKSTLLGNLHRYIFWQKTI